MLFCRFLIVAAFVCSLLSRGTAQADGPFAGAMPVPADYAAGFDSITEADSEALLKHLVEGDMSGRGTGQEGFVLAARWFASQLEANGFQPAGENGSWFQNIPFFKMATSPDGCSFKVGDEICIPGSAVGISTFFGTFEGIHSATFATVRNERPEITEGAMAGRLLVLQAERRIGPDDAFILKARPACVLIVADDGRVRNEAVNQSEESPSAIPVAFVTRAAANALAAKCGIKADFFVEGSPRGNSTEILENLMIASSVTVDCRLMIERESVDVPNVVGWYPGSDKSLRHEHICIGAHLDHLGVQRGSLFPGADDNGSGSASILQVAKAIHANPIKPKRSVLLIAFCAEERGLLGSKYYSAHPLKPIKEMICMLNIDMVGRNEETATEAASENENTIHLVGSKDHSQQLHDLVQQANQHVGFVFEYDEEDRVDRRSDHASFSEKGIPVAFLFGGFNPHYHQPSDTMDGINFSKIANAARLNYLVLQMSAAHGPFTMDVKE